MDGMDGMEWDGMGWVWKGGWDGMRWDRWDGMDGMRWMDGMGWLGLD